MHRLLVVTALLAIVASASPAARSWAQTPVASPAAGVTESSITVNGRSLHVACVGTGSPTVVFEEGGPDALGGASLVAEVGPGISAALGVRFCAYDRAGSGKSDPDPAGVRSFTDDALDLVTVLASPALACPCVVVGESLGGGIALLALGADATGFAGLVLLDATYPGSFDDLLALAPAGSPEAAMATDPLMTGENPEQVDLVTGFRQVAIPSVPPVIPIVVVSHGAGNPPPCQGDACSAGYPVARLETAWQAGQAAMANALDARLVIATGDGHAIAGEDPGLVVGIVSEVIAAVHDPQTWATPVPSPVA
jgi:pimeloyl-ACP methyl ester carboxylesterase